MEKICLSVPELAEQMQISRPTAYELVKREDFPKVCVGRRILIPRREFEAWLSEQVHGNQGGARCE